MKRDSPSAGFESAHPSSSEPQSLQSVAIVTYFSLLELSRETLTRLYTKLQGSARNVFLKINHV